MRRHPSELFLFQGQVFQLLGGGASLHAFLATMSHLPQRHQAALLRCYDSQAAAGSEIKRNENPAHLASKPTHGQQMWWLTRYSFPQASTTLGILYVP